jgi:hypothetical protein
MKKRFNYKMLLMCVFFFVGSTTIDKLAAQRVETTITYQSFYDGLSPYGIWIDYPGYGHVWHPSVDGNFRPYFTNGYWDYSVDGWIWISNYSWGWAPFHYGRWLYDDLYGWLWIPGYEWSPAWVIWGDVDNYYAWAPLMPSVNVVVWYGTWRPPVIYWNVVNHIYIYDRDISNRGRSNIDYRFTSRIRINNNYATTRYHNQYYAKGPEVNEVENYINRKIAPVSLREVKKAAPTTRDRNELQVYRPKINNPEPRTYRSIDKVSPNPVRTNTDYLNTDRIQQKRNVQQLPVRKSPENRPTNRTIRSKRSN